MAHPIALVRENKPLRTVVGTVGVLAVLVVFTEVTLRTIVPITVIFGAVMAHDLLDEIYDLPEGANWLAYGAAIFVVGIAFVVIHPAPWGGSLFALVGLWFVFDGVTIIRYGPSRTTHEYLSALEEDQMGETMLRMQTLNVVYQGLRDASEPQTVPGLATDLDLTESRVESALEFLESRGRVEQEGNRCRVEPSRWGRLTPVVKFLIWLPRRVVRPFRRITTNV
ncbi:hypothetical protein [Natronorubrum halophilum]|uniref:hypothetical protein n=1 Tax=Natronorubrum halophilum TaxID=1702106 RepID=UPI0010C21A48|nr:hypothetical protein [Natronorubrum halophilum]